MLAFLVGISAAFFTANRRFFGRRFLLSLSSVPLCMPPLLIALGFVSFFGVSGTLNSVFAAVSGKKFDSTFLYSFLGIVVAQGFYNFPLVMATVHDSWIRIPEERAEAARLLGAGEWRIFRTVTVFSLLPAIASSCMLVFLYCFFSFLIILLFGGVGCTTFEVEIYTAARSTLDFFEVLRLSIAETVLALIFVAFYAFLERRGSSSRGISFSRRTGGRISGGREGIFFGSVVFLVLIFFIAPFFSILWNAFSSAKSVFTLSTFRKILSMGSFLPSVFSTVFVAVLTSLFCVIVAFFYSSFLRIFDRGERILFLRILPMLPMGVSSVVLGVLITLIFPRGTVLHLVFAQVFLSWPLAFRQINASLSKIERDTVDAALVLSARRRDLVFRIFLPSARRGILSAAGFCFAASAGDTTLPLVLSVPNFSSLSLFTYRLAGSYRLHESCAAGVVLAAICAAFFFLADRFKER